MGKSRGKERDELISPVGHTRVVEVLRRHAPTIGRSIGGLVCSERDRLARGSPPDLETDLGRRTMFESGLVGTVEAATESQPRFVQFTVGAKDAEYVFPRGQNGGWRGVLFPT